MTHTHKLARDEFITEALRAVNDAIGNEEPHAQAFRIIAAIKGLREDKVRVAGGGIDYLERVQNTARDVWIMEFGGKHGNIVVVGPQATAGIDTPIGRLRCTTWRTLWKGERAAWASEYSLNDEPITVREIKAAGLAQRPTTRNRQKRKLKK